MPHTTNNHRALLLQMEDEALVLALALAAWWPAAWR
jgi:hypothetical protein